MMGVDAVAVATESSERWVSTLDSWSNGGILE